jgi:hypothetical protein
MTRTMLNAQERADLIDRRKEQWSAARAKEIVAALTDDREMVVEECMSWPERQATAWGEFECWLGERPGRIRDAITGGALPAARVEFAEAHAEYECDKLPDSFFVAEICND